ncbi:flagellar hook protein FlgE [Natranaerobius trueperi]|uniref:Flagellar hook protein FlgE n=1 Tax=Natranaerobius trueperi TaxID=759412 RepID=A0A226BYY4_9FIRM|nr:flagellar hook protein FlgE [Natranaerobius trueperi]OWZ84233.1 hypothetical protein CDO51_04030 [Natranaerobius trueperi]
MLRSLNSGVAGLRNHQERLDTIGNNIANVNTAGFKADRVTFEEAFNQTLESATAPNDRGGTNPQQIGLGMNIGSMDTIHTQGSLENTGRRTDLAIEGDGFFTVNDGESDYFTRVGNFGVDSDGNLVSQSTGYKVQGYQVDEDGGIDTDEMGDIEVPLGDVVSPKATENVSYRGNLDSKTEEEDSVTTTVDVYDALGGKHTIDVTFTKQEGNEWEVEFSYEDENGNQETVEADDNLTFDNNGEIKDGEIANLNLDLGDDVEDLEIEFDLSNITQYSDGDGNSTVEGTVEDGRQQGDLEDFGINAAGVVTGIYSNGETRELGQITMADFSNPAGLNKEGSGLYTPSQNSGEPRFGIAGSGGRGEIRPGALEMSNVDMSQEFTDMIVTQRGFQANSRTISTGDEVLQELVNLK